MALPDYLAIVFIQAQDALVAPEGLSGERVGSIADSWSKYAVGDVGAAAGDRRS
jgi:hypothetical protein